MTLIGFTPTNHPQQTGKRGASDTVDERITPRWLFDDLHAEFQFTLDAAASARNAQVPRYFDLESDGLSRPWSGERVWCNPPYSNIPAWVEKAAFEILVGCEVAVLLLPANRTEQRWWQNFVEPRRDGRGPIETRFLARRLNFGTPGNESGKYRSSAPFGCVVLIFS